MPIHTIKTSPRIIVPPTIDISESTHKAKKKRLTEEETGFIKEMVEECIDNIFDSYQDTVRAAEMLLMEENECGTEFSMWFLWQNI